MDFAVGLGEGRSQLYFLYRSLSSSERGNLPLSGRPESSPTALPDCLFQSRDRHPTKDIRAIQHDGDRIQTDSSFKIPFLYRLPAGILERLLCRSKGILRELCRRLQLLGLPSEKSRHLRQLNLHVRSCSQSRALSSRHFPSDPEEQSLRPDLAPAGNACRSPEWLGCRSGRQ